MRDVCRLQNDHVSPAARAALPVLEQLPDTAPGARLDLVERLGPPGPAWRWGEHHFARLDHPLARLRNPPAWARGRHVARPGSADTVDLTAYDGSGRQYHGASFRIVVDVGSWDESVAVNAPGQSGDPRSPHHDDLTELWSRGGYFPLVYSREAVDRHRESTLHLLPRAE